MDAEESWGVSCSPVSPVGISGLSVSCHRDYDGQSPCVLQLSRQGSGELSDSSAVYGTVYGVRHGCSAPVHPNGTEQYCCRGGHLHLSVPCLCSASDCRGDKGRRAFPGRAGADSRGIALAGIPADLSAGYGPVILSAAGMAYIVSFSQYFLTLLIGGGQVRTFQLSWSPICRAGSGIWPPSTARCFWQ